MAARGNPAAFFCGGSWVSSPSELTKEEFNAQMAVEKERIDLLTSSLQSEREQRIRLEERVQNAPPPKEPDPPKIYTRAELDQMVEGGQLTEAAKEDVLAQQQEHRINQIVSARVDERVSVATKAQRVDGELGRYIEKMPDLTEADSDNRKRVDAEFQFLVGLDGPPKTDAERVVYELKACRAAFGPVAGVQETTRPETHKETGGAGDADEGGSGNEAPEGTPANLVAHYETQFEKGRYTGWDDPKVVKELSYVRKAG